MFKIDLGRYELFSNDYRNLPHPNGSGLHCLKIFGRAWIFPREILKDYPDFFIMIFNINKFWKLLQFRKLELLPRSQISDSKVRVLTYPGNGGKGKKGAFGEVRGLYVRHSL